MRKITTIFRQCTKCNQLKHVDMFYWQDKVKGYRHSWCKRCTKAESQKYENTPERKKHRRLYNQTPERKALQLLQSQKPERRAIKSKYKQSPRGKEVDKKYRIKHGKEINARNLKRKHSKINRTPKWADLKAIKQFYANTPPGMTVDHIIPLQGKLVSGLHVLNNLQYLTPGNNYRKRDKFDPVLFNNLKETI